MAKDVGTAGRASLDENGHEVPDSQPLVMPAGFRRPETLAEQVQRLVRGSLSRMAAEQGMETFEESEDFDIEDDQDVSTPYETFFDPVLGKELTPHEFKQHEALYRQRYLEAQRNYFATLDRTEALQRPRKAKEPTRAPEPARGAGVSPAHAQEPKKPASDKEA